MEDHHTFVELPVNLFRGREVKVTRPINSHTVNVQYLSNRKAYTCTNFKLGTQTEHEDPHH